MFQSVGYHIGNMNRAGVFVLILFFNVLSVAYSGTIVTNQSPLETSPGAQYFLNSSNLFCRKTIGLLLKYLHCCCCIQYIYGHLGLHSVIDASLGSESLKEHLESIVKLDAPIPATLIKPIQAALGAPIPAPLGGPIPDALKLIPESTDETEPNENHDLKTDETSYYGYGGYRYSPYYSYNGYPYYSNYYNNNWQYGSYYNQPYYSRRYYPG